MNEWWAGMALIAGGLGVLICLAALVDYWWKESIREIRDIWHEDETDVERRKPRRRTR